MAHPAVANISVVFCRCCVCSTPAGCCGSHLFSWSVWKRRGLRGLSKANSKSQSSYRVIVSCLSNEGVPPSVQLTQETQRFVCTPPPLPPLLPERAARATASDYTAALGFARRKRSCWAPPVLRCSALRAEGISEVWEQVRERERDEA